jgi:hypothetical protein
MTEFESEHPGVLKLRRVIACKGVAKGIAGPVLDVGDPSIAFATLAQELRCHPAFLAFVGREPLL